MRGTKAAVAVAVGGAVTLLLSACGGGGGGGSALASGNLADCPTNLNACNTVPADQVQQGGQITFAIEKNIDNWNVISSEGNVFETGMATKAFLPYTFGTTPDLKSALNTNLMVSADQTNPTTLVYKIKPNAAWDDGKPIDANDFVYGWKVQNPKTCPECETAGNGGYDQITNVVGSDNGKTVTVTLAKPYTDWQSFWGSAAPLYPAHIAAQHGDLNTPQGLASSFTWLGANVPTYTGGPYKIQNWQNNQALTLVPNPKWYGDTKPTLERLVMRVITDATQEPIALQNNEVQVVYPQPQVDIVNQIQQIPNVSQTQQLGLTWEHFDFNLQSAPLKDKALRQALYTAVNRQDIIAKTVGQFNPEVKPLDSLMFLPQQPEYKDNLTASGYGSGDIEKAKQILTQAGYTGVGTALAKNGQAVPPLRIRYTVGNSIRQNECELFAQYAKQLGVTVNVEPTDSLGKTTSSGDYDIIVFAWVQSPFPYGGAQQLWLSNSGSNYGKYQNPKTDQLINAAANSTDKAAAGQQLNQADEIILGDAYVLPIYQKPTLLAQQNTVANVRGNATLDGPMYNVAEWGLRTQ
ncbi:peptide/nickel transport system substrate-binding protein [Pseudonocardia sediminis]|uniref:Peptide/nickel transport system substrate-binding protein n=1 Tax=Pseudonocardia sediminis TaxID=1397368 RepID=A0A4Q7UT73_PSEST|nr:ABC transporter family substrate-binding protein [Pseudonocardia sediminis]RZT84048.1 peptide/nickel transport system substrate-binding protein [Pseudonocardia sediminis]